LGHLQDLADHRRVHAFGAARQCPGWVAVVVVGNHGSSLCGSWRTTQVTVSRWVFSVRCGLPAEAVAMVASRCGCGMCVIGVFTVLQSRFMWGGTTPASRRQW